MKNLTNQTEQIYKKFCEALIECFPQIYEFKKIAVAVSGGSDSTALALLLSQFCRKNKISLTALIVSHRFRRNSDQEAQEAYKNLGSHKIEAEILYLSEDKLPKSNIEANLRELRYGAMLDFCQKKQIPAIFFGHHLGDVAENFLIRLFRGSHLDGLATIASLRIQKKIFLVRPLLNFSKSELQQFLQQKKVNWQEDESNLDEVFLRNKIRKFLGEFPENEVICKRIKKASDAICECRDLLGEVARNWEEEIFQKFPILDKINQKNSDFDFTSIGFEQAKEFGARNHPKEIEEILTKIAKSFSESFAKKSRIKLEKSMQNQYQNSDFWVSLKDCFAREFAAGFLVDCKKLALCPKPIAVKILTKKIQEIGEESYKPRFSKLNNFYNFLVDPKTHQNRHPQHINNPEIYFLANCQAIFLKNFCGIFASKPA